MRTRLQSGFRNKLSGTIETFGRHLNIFGRLPFLPYDVYKIVKAQHQPAKQDIVKEFDLESLVKVIQVKNDRSYFYEQPNDKRRKNSYVIKGDKLFLNETRGVWVRDVYTGKKGSFEGWLKMSELDFND